MSFQVALDDEVLTLHTRISPASVELVWGVLADGWLFDQWAVGATPVRKVDRHWPDAGSRLHHAFGWGPLAFKSETRVLASEPGRLLKLRADGWPNGPAEMTITLEPMGEATLLRISELADAGPRQPLPATTKSMLVNRWSNEALQRLSALAQSHEV